MDILYKFQLNEFALNTQDHAGLERKLSLYDFGILYLWKTMFEEHLGNFMSFPNEKGYDLMTSLTDFDTGRGFADVNVETRNRYEKCLYLNEHRIVADVHCLPDMKGKEIQ